MAVSSKDIETLWRHYTEVERKRGVSVAQYFESNSVPFHVFDRCGFVKSHNPSIYWS